jgi:myo-inositol-1(or 4)-monophosphatase
MAGRKRSSGGASRGGGRGRAKTGQPTARRRTARKGGRADSGRVITITAERRRAATRRRRSREESATTPSPTPSTGGDAIDFHLAACIMCVRAGGRVIMDYWGKRGQFVIEEKGRNDYVTIADREAEDAITRVVRARFPDHTIVAEESGSSAGSAGYRWYIDPLDGTTNFVHGYPLFCVSVGIADAQGMRAAAVYDPLRDEMFTAARGRGAMLNGEPIHVSAIGRLTQGLIVTGIPFRSLDRLEEYLRSLRAVVERSAGIRRDGSAALNLAYTACGRYEGFWEMGLSSWDVAAGSLIVQEAGGVVTDFAGRHSYIDSGDIIAANPEIHPSLLEIVREAYRSD